MNLWNLSTTNIGLNIGLSTESEVIAADIEVITADTEVIATDTDQKGNKVNLLM